ncbi:hypothetical protein [Sphingomonas koreensis]|uniref:hypothetical protein n=1 Tax=Sphingomonas koreensis TaxID=93064 RepID=UPI0013DE1CD8|nr:hypothetical protein [Sphingomonas koreensis]
MVDAVEVKVSFTTVKHEMHFKDFAIYQFQIERYTAAKPVNPRPLIFRIIAGVYRVYCLCGNPAPAHLALKGPVKVQGANDPTTRIRSNSCATNSMKCAS